jgi:DNA-binding CsgD family transcriptional regulator
LPLYAGAIDAVRGEDRELALTLETARLSTLILLAGEDSGFEREAERFRDLAGDTPAECALLGLVARARMFAGAPAGDVVPLARRAIRHLRIERSGPFTVWFVGAAVWLPGKDLTEHLECRFGEEIERASERGSAQGFAGASWLRAIIRLHTGDLRGAEADALAAAQSGGSDASFPYQPLVALTESLGEQGRGDEAEAELADRGLGGALPLDRPYTALLIARGRMRAARGDLDAARADLEEGLRRLTVAGTAGVVGLDARLELALIRHAIGDDPSALVAEALAAAQAWGAERAVGAALHVAGLLQGDVERLREAAAMLAASPARLWEARALVDLGAALRRANRRRESREPLRAGLALAEQCGAGPLAERARRELAAGGGRVPARPEATELTASEQRVAELAASGLSNPEIAQRLFVTIKTVEMHLSNAYRKLGVRSRHELPGALATASR